MTTDEVSTPISVSVVVPVYNGQATLGALVDELAALTTPQQTGGGLTYVVDSVVLAWDHGKDASDELIRELAAEHSWVRPVWLSRNFGQHPATCAGILATGSDWVVTMDEDGQHDPAYIGAMLDRAYETRSQLVYANPSNRPPHSFLRNLASRTAKRVFKWLIGNATVDVDFHSYRLMAGGVGRVVAASIGPGVYLDVALAWVVPTVTSADVPMRTEGRPATSYTPRRLASHFWRLVLSSGTKPLRVISGVGVISAFLGFALGIFYVIQKATGDVHVQGWTTVMVGGLVGGGLILLSLGVIAEYLGMIAARSMGRTSYLVVADPQTAFPGATDSK
ncbi:glycosyltransferase family 2 protein [Aeromicrobium panaciterrae]|uniref:glycosyltransferase n=1 Tax=Aeromicrobium panaciterrae TaxID=363861 RepID=UPI0031DB162B